MVMSSFCVYEIWWFSCSKFVYLWGILNVFFNIKMNANTAIVIAELESLGIQKLLRWCCISI